MRADRVKLTAGDAAEELTLKVAAGPKTTIQPAVAVAPPQPTPGAPGAPQPATTTAAPQPGQTQDVAEVLANRRRAARAAEATAQQQNAQPPVGAQPATPAQQTPKSGDPGWNDVYQRYIQRQK